MNTHARAVAAEKKWYCRLCGKGNPWKRLRCRKCKGKR